MVVSFSFFLVNLASFYPITKFITLAKVQTGNLKQLFIPWLVRERSNVVSLNEIDGQVVETC